MTGEPQTGGLEFGSREYVAKLRALLQAHAHAAPAGERLVICEVLTGVPAHLDRDGSGKLAWHCVFEDGRFEFAETPVDEADSHTVADYAFARVFARATSAQLASPDLKTFAERGIAAGKGWRGGRDRSKVPAAFAAIHDELARQTA